MKSPMFLLQQVLSDLGTRCGTSTQRDWETISSRVEAEGLSFITITLPSFCKDFEEALDLGRVASEHFAGFRRRSGLPAFLQGFLGQIFDSGTGVLLDDVSDAAIQAVRQITLMNNKIKLECSIERTNAAFLSYVKCEREVRDGDRHRSPGFVLDYRRISRLLWVDLFTEIDRKVYYGELLPKHGPGATANRAKGNAKFAVREWTERLDCVFPWLENAAASWSQYSEAQCVYYRSPKEEIPVRVISVPKTLKTPRIIAIEPSYMQYMQQALMEAFEQEFEHHKNARHFVRYKGTQQINQKLARLGSLDGSLATLDLSEASDRVSNQLVRAMLEPHPHLFDGVDACRSRRADVPGHGVLRLAKFASMGSALTFPFEALVFTTLIFMGIERDLGHQLTDKDVKSYIGRVRVYGDDIIVPVEHVPSVIGVLEANGLKVNRRKSFWIGRFRESCGKEYYAGTDVSIVRVRNMLPSSQTDVEELVSAVSLRNQLRYAGFDRGVKYLDKLISDLIPFPIVGENSPALGRHEFGLVEPDRMNPSLHRAEVRAMVVDAKLPKNSISGYDALLKMYLKRSQQPFEDPLHLTMSGRPVAVSIKRRWVPAA